MKIGFFVRMVCPLSFVSAVVLVTEANARAIAAAGCSQQEVQKAIVPAVDGDVHIPGMPDNKTATGFTYDLVLKEPLQARYLRSKAAAERIFDRKRGAGAAGIANLKLEI
jgi:hypothetical protein